jgi:transcription antitermination factor NusG
MNETLTLAPERIEEIPGSTPGWYALWTRSHCEPLVSDQLAAKGFEVFLIRVPMFSGYLFLRRVMDKSSYIEIKKARGLVDILGDRWDRLPTIPDAEMDAVQRIADASAPALPYPYLRQGQRVRLTCGPLADLDGILVRTKPNRGLLVISVELLKRSVAVEVDCTSVVPV